MLNNINQSKRRSPVNQGVHADISGPNKIGASTPYDFEAHNPYTMTFKEQSV